MSGIDVAIIGSGIAGLSAAISARESGAASVVVLEAAKIIGGSSRLSGGMLLGAGSSIQRSHGIADSVEAFYTDYMNLNQWNVSADAVRTFTREAGVTIDWLASQGVPIHEQPVHSGPEFVPRGAAAIGHGEAIVSALFQRAKVLGVDFVLDHRVSRLLVDDEGGVEGLVAAGEEVRASAVVVATGGFGANPEKLATFFPSSASAGEWMWYIGADSSQGDAIDIGVAVNARIVGHDKGLRLLSPGFVRTLESYIPAWQVMVNREGRRYVDESAAYGILDHMTRVNGDVAYFIFDQQAVDPDSGPSQSAYKQVIPGREDLRSNPNWNSAMIREKVGAGAIKTAATLDELGLQLGIPGQQLKDTVLQYNNGAKTGMDACGKDAKFIREISRPPYYGAEVRLAAIAVTATGLAIDGNSAVLNEAGYPINGLFAAGECTGGVIGDVYFGGGNSLMNGAVFGRVAGMRASKHVSAPAI